MDETMIKTEETNTDNVTVTTDNENNRPPRHVNKKFFDMEYSTQIKAEYQFLEERGIKCSYKYRDKEYHIPTYKYTKTPELFLAVAEFYKMWNARKVDTNA